MGAETSEFNKTGERFDGTHPIIDSMGEIIAAEGPGKGFASYPWILDKYERVLGLAPNEVWLLHRMLKHVWKSDGVVFISMRKVCQEAMVSRKSLDKYIKSLLRQGYISIIGRGRKLTDHTVRYDVSGLFNALMVAISCDPGSKYAKRGFCFSICDWFSSPEEEWKEINTPAGLNEWHNARGLRFNWSEFQNEPLETGSNGGAYIHKCDLCHNDFSSPSPYAKYCPSCKEEIRQQRWRTFKTEYNRFEETYEED